MLKLIQHVVTKVPCTPVRPVTSGQDAAIFPEKLADVRIFDMEIVVRDIQAHGLKEDQVLKVRKAVTVHAARCGATVTYCLCIIVKKGLNILIALSYILPNGTYS